MVDQHIADERYIYEQLKKSRNCQYMIDENKIAIIILNKNE